MGWFGGLMGRKAHKITQQELYSLIGAEYPTDSGPVITPDNALRLAPVYSCARVLAESVGMLPVDVFQRQGRNNVEVDGELSWILGTQPNELMTSQEFWESCITGLAMRGNFHAWINIVRGEVRELLPFAPGSVEAKVREDQSLVYHIRYANGSEDVLPAAEVFHVRLFSLDGINGLSPVGFARESMGLSAATQKHGAKLFQQGTVLSGTLSTDNALGEEAYQRIKRSWADAYSGTNNAHKVAILEQGLKFHSRQMSSEDAQFLETRQYQRSEIAGIYRVPPHMIGDMNGATFSNIEHQGLQFLKYALMPYLTRIEKRIRVSLIPRGQQRSMFAKFNSNAFARGDMKTRGEYYTRMIQNGAMSPNEIRGKEDMNPRDGGDIYLTPLNMAIDGQPAAVTEQ